VQYGLLLTLSIRALAQAIAFFYALVAGFKAIVNWLLLPLPLQVKEVMFSPLFICLCVGYLKKLWMEPDEIWWEGWVCD